MNTTLGRLIFVYVLLHIICFFVEWYRFTHSNWSWKGFKDNGMLDISYILMISDILGSIAFVVYWILQPHLETIK